MPCRIRNPTICPIDCAMPHNIEAIVKPVIDTRNNRVRPNRVARNPTGAVMIAVATI